MSHCCHSFHCVPALLTTRIEYIPPRVAVYGGAFNPITNAHLNVASEIVHSELADEVWIVPCGNRSDKPELATS